MDTGERLAAYLSGELDPDERTALEAELAGDPGLRARLDRVRAADEALAAMPEVELPEGFSDRLHRRLAPELDAVLGDELAARRARRSAPRWLPALGAAAVLALVVAGGVGILSTGGGDDTAEDMAAGDTRVTAEAGGDGEAGMAEESMGAPVAGPLVVDRGRTLTPQDLEQLANDPDVQAALRSDVVQDDPTMAAQQFSLALGATSAAGGADTLDDAETRAEVESETAHDDQTEAADSTPGALPLPPVATQGEVDDDDRAAVAACLPVLFEDAASPVVPLYAELATDEDGTPVIVFAALSPDAEGDFQRVEVWVLDRGTCEPRLFLQSEAQPVERNAP